MKNNLKDSRLGGQIAGFIQGAVIGASAVLPGVSAGVLCVVFGIFRPIMSFIGHPVENCRVGLGLIPVGLGWLFGFFGMSRAVGELFGAAESAAAWLFIGLIAGTAPALWRDVNKKGRTRGSWPAFIIAFAALCALLAGFKLGRFPTVEPNIWWFLFCGAMWGVSLVVPGLKTSSILIALGLYLPLTEGIGTLDMGVLIPWLLGMAAVAASFSRLVSRLFERRYQTVSYAVLGVVAASTAAIIPLSYADGREVLLSIAALGVGACAAWALERLGRKYSEKR